MTQEETLQVLAILKAAYPNMYNGMTSREAKGTVAVWSLQFANVSVEIVLMAVQKLISTNKFPPTVAEVKTKIESIHWEAWEKINSPTTREVIPAELLQQYQRIYEETKAYKLAKCADVPLSQMIAANAQKRIGSKEHD